jgi:hypothetical protein
MTTLYSRSILLAGFLLLMVRPTFAGKLSDPKVQTELRDEVEKIIPDGYLVTRTRTCALPPDWHTDDPRPGFLVEGGNGADTFQIVFLPRDWIGIRKVSNRAPRTLYGEGILANEDYLTITFATKDDFQDRVQNLFRRSMSTPSLIHVGYPAAETVFGTGGRETDRITLALVKKYCKTPKEFVEAAHSLVVLGVPARIVLLRAAREVQGKDKDCFCSALGSMGGEDAIEVLCEVVADAKVEDQRRKRAAMALDGQRGNRIGPALQKALLEIRDEDSLKSVVRALTHLRYQPAGPGLLAAFKRMENDYYRVEVAHALAALGLKEATPVISGFVERLRKNGKGSEELRQRAELALLRLTGEWGKPAEGMRLRLEAPQRVQVGEEARLSIYVENVGEKPFELSPDPRPWITLNGQPLERRDEITCCQVPLVRPGEVYVLSFDLSESLIKDGVYKIQYALSEARSNVVTLTVGPSDKKFGGN